MKINLIDLFPEPLDPLLPRGPLPKQKEFIQQTFSKVGPKFIAYIGGVGSGKSRVLCVNIIMQAVMYGGEYVICRHFMPELRRTTLKIFLEACPKDLIIEYRVADAEVHLKSTTGKPAIIHFVGLDEPDKLRSLSLSGVGIDECTQISEEAFLSVIHRLRNPNGLRKVILVGNPAGHDWVYHRFSKKDVHNTYEASQLYSLILAPSTENFHLGKDYIDTMKQVYTKEKYETEVMGSFDSFVGQVYDEFTIKHHVISPFNIPKHWTRVLGIDHGFRNPAAAVMLAVDGDGNVYVTNEFYNKEWLIKEIVNGKGDEPGLLQMVGDIKLEVAAIDPSTKAVRSEGVKKHGLVQKYSDYDTYCEYLPDDFPLICGNNEVSAGLDRCKSYFKIDTLTSKPRLFIFDTCKHLIDEIQSYRWAELPENTQGLRNKKESVYKFNDHLVDALRYAIMTRPDPTQIVEDIYQKIKYNSLEGRLHRELESIHSRKSTNIVDYE